MVELFAGQSGSFVLQKETISGFKGLLSGEYDDIPEQVFLYCGGIDKVKKIKYGY